MNFTVLWTPSAERDLADLWLEAADRDAVRSAADTLDRLLRIDAHLRGESRYETIRVVHAAPPGVDIEVDEGNRAVWVLRVWRFSQRGSQQSE